jgi:hypothetical protein
MSYEMSVHTGVTWRSIPEVGILHLLTVGRISATCSQVCDTHLIQHHYSLIL